MKFSNNFICFVFFFFICSSGLIEQRKEKIPVDNGFIADPFEEVDHDVERLAKEFERKYGNSYSGSDSRSMKNLAIDKGSGYDENNGFIDDTEAVSVVTSR